MKTRIEKFLLLAVIGGLSLIPARRSEGQIFTNLHNLVFTNGTGPQASLTLSGNILYGTGRTYGGGLAGGAGSAFRMNVDGSSFTNLHTFTESTNENTDCGNIASGLVLSGTTLYGMGTFRGATNDGAIFKINTDGTGVTNIYNFSPILGPFPSTNSDGGYPDTSLILSGSTLYGTTSGGGAYGWGIAFSVKTNGTGFTNLHSFALPDGQYPGTLVLAGGSLYGTAGGGGSSMYGCIFRMNTNGSGFTNLYSFTAKDYATKTNGDGVFPAGSLIVSGTTLYGTTSEGGFGDGGTVFRIETNGTDFTTLYHFDATNGVASTNSSGAHSASGLLLWNDSLYGTTKLGGKSGNGTVFRLTTNGTDFTVLYSFSATNATTNLDGAQPIGGLILSGNKLFGTTSTGGTASYGTIFSIQAPPPLFIARSGTNALLTWDTNITGFTLQMTTNLGSSWTNLSGQFNVTNSMTGARKLYRLMH